MVKVIVMLLKKRKEKKRFVRPLEFRRLVRRKRTKKY